MRENQLALKQINQLPGYYTKDTLAPFVKWGLKDLPEGSIDLKVAIADMIVEHVYSIWMQIDLWEKPSIEFILDYDWRKARVHFKNDFEPELKENPNLKAW